ncbi:phage baseplate assembly protein [Neisseria elongata]|uniref:phage baseplate assembly protein n=1 Tax=Neisseria elongata TaxID=495 RepID=UPI001F38AC55|nr:phage baseplate assembly protein [Neisseria elongata]
MQRTQIEGLDGETVQALEHAEQFGFTAHPPAGSDCIVLPLAGDVVKYIKSCRQQ